MLKKLLHNIVLGVCLVLLFVIAIIMTVILYMQELLEDD